MIWQVLQLPYNKQLLGIIITYHNCSFYWESELQLQLTLIFTIDYAIIFFFSINCLLRKMSVFPKYKMTPKCLVLATTQRYSLYCLRGIKKPEHFYILLVLMLFIIIHISISIYFLKNHPNRLINYKTVKKLAILITHATLDLVKIYLTFL